MIDQEALTKFEKIYADSYNDISKYVICNCSNIEDVKDIIQNVYLEVVKNINKIENTSYIIGIARNKIKDYYRFNYKRLLFCFDNNKENIEDIPDNINVEEILLKSDKMDKIWTYLKRKSIIISKIFYLYYYLNMTIKEISKELKLKESSVKNYLYRTLRELSAYLESESDESVK